jgi:dTMP kinase
MTAADAPRLRFGPREGPGTLITVEGLDGSGKTTIVGRLRDHLSRAGVPVVVTRLPTTEMRGSRFFQLLRNEGRTDLVDPVAFEVAYMVDRIQHCRTVIGPALRSGRTVITDRYVFSSVGTLLLRLPDLREAVVDAVLGGGWFADLSGHLIRPHLSLVLRTDPRTGAARLRSRPDEADVDFEPREYEELQDLLLRLARANDMTPVDSGGSPEETLAACLPYVEQLGLTRRRESA